MKNIGTLCFIVFFPLLGRAQIPAITSHYPASAYVVNRLLPFVVSGDAVEVVRVDIQPVGLCSSLVDPFYPETFHLYCRQPGVVNLRVWVQDPAGLELELEVENLAIAVQRAPSDGFDEATRETFEDAGP